MSDSPRRIEQTLLATTDMMVWAQEFCRIFSGRMVGSTTDGTVDGTVEEGTMVGWFANAFELGRSTGRKELCPHEFYKLADDMWACHDCGTVTDEAPDMTNEEAFLEGFQEGRVEDG